MPQDVEFQGCDATTVFAEVSGAAESEETQSLWDRLLEEMATRRVTGAASYLEAEFQRLTASLDRELTRLENE